MKALACKQPWAYALVDGVKTIEVRSRRTDYRGPLLITASASPNNVFWQQDEANLRLLHAGCMIGVVELVDCRLMQKSDDDDSMGNYMPSSYAWVMKARHFVVPGVIKSQLGFFEVADALIKPLAGEQWLFDFPCPQGDVKYRPSCPVIG